MGKSGGRAGRRTYAEEESDRGRRRKRGRDEYD